MPNRKKKGRKQKKQSGGGSWGSVRLGGFQASFPQPRLPRLLGAAVSLPASMAVYPRVNLDFAITLANSGIVAGSLAAAYGLDITLINAWNTRVQNLFREYAIVGANLEIRIMNVVTPSGLVIGYIDEKSSAAPTATEASNRPRLDMAVVQMTSVAPYRLKWTPRDLLDLQWTAISVTETPAWFKLFCTPAGTGTQNTTTGNVMITGSLAVAFRGYA